MPADSACPAKREHGQIRPRRNGATETNGGTLHLGNVRHLGFVASRLPPKGGSYKCAPVTSATFASLVPSSALKAEATSALGGGGRAPAVGRHRTSAARPLSSVRLRASVPPRSNFR